MHYIDDCSYLVLARSYNNSSICTIKNIDIVIYFWELVIEDNIQIIIFIPSLKKKNIYIYINIFR